MTSRNRTWLCCVVFLDVVSFTKHHMQDQLAIKAHLDKQIRLLLKNHAKEDYILLDRGDGAAVCFLVEPETALYFALNLRDAVRALDNCPVAYEIRIGINLGPIKIILDVNGDKTTLGEGINCAARVMDFAGEGQIYVSRSFYEVIGCLSQEYAELFSYLGKRADKHVREFELYEVAAARGQINETEQQQTPENSQSDSDWDVSALQIREAQLTKEIGPMARVLVQRAAQKANTLEELDLILAKSSIHVAPECKDGGGTLKITLDTSFLRKADRLLSEYLGPIATLLVKQAASQASDHASLGQMLAGELASKQEKQSFLSRLENE